MFSLVIEEELRHFYYQWSMFLDFIHQSNRYNDISLLFNSKISYKVFYFKISTMAVNFVYLDELNMLRSRT